MTESTRERKIKFIEDFGRDALRIAVGEMLAMYGSDWLTDEQVLDIVRDRIADWRGASRRNIRNRAIQVARSKSIGETGMVLGTGKERPLSVGLHTDSDPEARFESASLHQSNAIWPNWGDRPDGFDGPTGAE
jgi:hypothetical protein